LRAANAGDHLSGRMKSTAIDMGVPEARWLGKQMGQSHRVRKFLPGESHAVPFRVLLNPPAKSAC
jgi:hypothetical protein